MTESMTKDSILRDFSSYLVNQYRDKVLAVLADNPEQPVDIVLNVFMNLKEEVKEYILMNESAKDLYPFGSNKQVEESTEKFASDVTPYILSDIVDCIDEELSSVHEDLTDEVEGLSFDKEDDMLEVNEESLENIKTYADRIKNLLIACQNIRTLIM